MKIPKRIFHDFKGRAIRNMIRSGNPESAAVRISGHKTRSVFDRCIVVGDSDLKEAAGKQQPTLILKLKSR